MKCPECNAIIVVAIGEKCPHCGAPDADHPTWQIGEKVRYEYAICKVVGWDFDVRLEKYWYTIKQRDGDNIRVIEDKLKGFD